MSVLLYAVADAQLGPGPPPGIGNQPLRQLGHATPWAIVSDLEFELSTAHSNLWAYEQIVERLMDRATVIPARFGTTAGVDAEILEMLQARREEFRATLDRVRGSVEVAVHLDVPNSPQPPSARELSGRAYMHDLLERQRAQRAAAERADSAIGQIARDSRERAEGSRAYLVSREDVADFLARATALDLRTSGPWPPYSFVTP